MSAVSSCYKAQMCFPAGCHPVTRQMLSESKQGKNSTGLHGAKGCFWWHMRCAACLRLLGETWLCFPTAVVKQEGA